MKFFSLHPLKTFVVVAVAALVPADAALAQSTEERLRELEQLRKEVERRRASLNVLKKALGSEDVAGEIVSSEAGIMTRSKSEAELRVMRAELQILREELAKKRSAPAEPGKIKANGQVRTRFEWNDTYYKVFDTLFASNHKFYGFMDFFLDLPVDTVQRGLLDAMLKGEVKASRSVKIGLDIHYFPLVQGGEKYLGQEIDASEFLNTPSKTRTVQMP